MRNSHRQAKPDKTVASASRRGARDGVESAVWIGFSTVADPEDRAGGAKGAWGCAPIGGSGDRAPAGEWGSFASQKLEH